MDTPFPTYQGHGPYIFVCYAHEDSAAVYREIEWLSGQGINLWYDEGVSAGKETAEAMEGAVKILYYISSAALVSPTIVAARFTKHSIGVSRSCRCISKTWNYQGICGRAWISSTYCIDIEPRAISSSC